MICDFNEICKAINILKYGELFEIRILDGKKTYSGYFKDTIALQKELEEINVSSDASVYFTINGVKAECQARKQNNKLTYGCTTTSDNDIDRYKLIMVDVDPERVAGVSSSDEELTHAKEMMLQIGVYLKNNGFSSPLVAMSGNGYHLLYKIDLPNNNDTKQLIKTFLEALNALFSDNKCHVDTVNFNPARICKLYGTYATKGSDTSERPHRLSKILKVPEPFDITDISVIQRIVEINKPQETGKEQPTRYNNYNPQPYTVDDFIQKHGIAVKDTVKIANGVKYILDCCPFNSNHTGKDACLFQYNSGGKHFHCFHNGCADKTWKDFKLLYEPDAYSKNYNFTPTPNRYNVAPTEPIIQDVPIELNQEVEPIWLTAKEIRAQGQREWEFIPTGVNALDEKIGGIAKGRVILVSGLRASGKSSLLGQFAIEAVQKDYRVAMYSGELSANNVLKWLTLQIAGKNYTKPTKQTGVYSVDKAIQERIDDWLSDKLSVYNNNYGNNFGKLIREIEKTITEKKVDMVVIDNLMMLDISELSPTVNEQQKKVMQELKALANKYNVAIVLVAHPRKTQGFLRLEDVAGNNDIVNMVDDAIIIHRNNLDFRRKFDETMKGEISSSEFEGVSNVIEIAKNRELGVQDEFIKLYYTPEDKRLCNSKGENKMYGWIEIELEKPTAEKVEDVEQQQQPFNTATDWDKIDENDLLF